MFTALQLLGLGLTVAGLVVLAGVGGALIGAGVAVVYVGLAGER
jgi:hypothetical protein